MIPKDFIAEWRSKVPWQSSLQVEQDLVICRALLSIFQDSYLAEQFAFRGGTALSKLYLPTAQRYSEDIDLVQVRPETIGASFDRIRSVLDPWLGKPKRIQKEGRVDLIYRFESEEPVTRLRLKIEINSREHFSVFGFERKPFVIESRWIQGKTIVQTYCLDELLGTKLRALYQRRKGRDLFDLWAGLVFGGGNPVRVVQCFRKYLQMQKLTVSRREFLENFDRKIASTDFLQDMEPLLLPDFHYDPEEAAQLVRDKVLELL